MILKKIGIRKRSTTLEEIKHSIRTKIVANQSEILNKVQFGGTVGNRTSEKSTIYRTFALSIVGFILLEVHNKLKYIPTFRITLYIYHLFLEIKSLRNFLYINSIKETLIRCLIYCEMLHFKLNICFIKLQMKNINEIPENKNK